MPSEDWYNSVSAIQIPFEEEIEQAIMDLRVSHEITGGVTLIWMRSTSSENSLFQIISTTLDKPVDGVTGHKKVSTYYLTNRLLQKFIAKSSEQALTNLSHCKRKSMLESNPPYIVTRCLPEYNPEDDSDASSCDSDDDDYVMPYSLSDDDIVHPSVGEDAEGREIYSYTNGDISMTIQEPTGPSVSDYI